VQYDPEGNAYLSFEVENDNVIPPADTFFRVEDASLIIDDFEPFHYDPAVAGVLGKLDHRESSLTYTFDKQEDCEVDSMVFNSGNLLVFIDSKIAGTELEGINKGTYTVTIPALRNAAGESFNDSTSFGDTLKRSLADYSLAFDKEGHNSFEVLIDLDIEEVTKSEEDHYINLEPHVDFWGINTKEAYGYFGYRVLDQTSVSMKDITAFDGFRNSPDAKLQIKSASLYFTVHNGAGFPIELRIDTVRSIGSSTVEMPNVDSRLIEANKETDLYHKAEVVIGRDNLGTALSNMPTQVDFVFSTVINPEGRTRNFLIENRPIKIENAIEARIPLEFAVSNLMMHDTVDFDVSNVTFESMKLFVNGESKMPVSVKMQGYLLDAEGKDVRDESGKRVPLFTAPISIEAAEVGADGNVSAPRPYKENIATNVEWLREAKKIAIEIAVDTPDGSASASKFVRITKENFVHLRIGAEATVNIEKFD
jgi:hypothetical protein